MLPARTEALDHLARTRQSPGEARSEARTRRPAPVHSAGLDLGERDSSVEDWCWCGAVLEVGAILSDGGVDDAAGQSCGEDLVQLVDGEESGSAEFVLSDKETVDLGLVQSAAVEDDQQFVALGGVGCPVQDEHRAQGDVEAEFFFDVARRPRVGFRRSRR